MLNLNDADQALIRQLGPIIPEFMWPEDGTGYDVSATGIRPHPTNSVVGDPHYQSATNFGYAEHQYTFQRGYANTAGLEVVKNSLLSGNAVTISIDSHGFENGLFDPTTGLAVPSAWSKFSAPAATSHQVAVVGFDDDFYHVESPQNPGALIVRNSWNDQWALMQITRLNVEAPGVQDNLSRLRLKLSDVNLPGYYAIPYAYFQAFIAQNLNGSINVYSMNWVGYQAMSAAIESHYQVVSAPFACHTRGPDTTDDALDAWLELTRFANDRAVLADQTQRPGARANAKYDLQRTLEVESQGARAGHLEMGGRFELARLSRNSLTGVDRVKDFYSGAFDSYYCAMTQSDLDGTVKISGNGSVWPKWDIAGTPQFQKGAQAISEDNFSVFSWMKFFDSVGTLTIPQPAN